MTVIDKDALMDDLISLSSDVGKMGFEWLGRDDVIDTVRWQDEYELDEWFDVRDDQPDDTGRYWCTVEIDGTVYTDDYWYDKLKNEWDAVGDVIAWRYMPEPYRREEHATS